MLHRVLIVLATAVLVLAVLRQILPAGLAWLVAAWWAVMPVNFDTMYEVHLFSLIPLLVALLALWQGRSPWNRGTALALLLLSAFLVRNEIAVSVAGFAALCLLWEIRLGRNRNAVEPAPPAASLIVAYLIPVIVALVVVGYYYRNSDVRGDALRAEMHAKHVVSMGQAYALGYAERHTDWNKNPWADFEDACQADFRSPEPTLSDMLHTNPRALASHVLWNLRLIHHSIQLLLFNRSGGAVNPDVVEMPMKSRAAVAGSVGMLLLAGLALTRRKTDLWRQVFWDHRFEWLASAVMVAFTIPVALLVRPRPAYLFSVSVLLMAFLAACAWAVAGHWPIWRRLSVLTPAVMLALIFFVPGAYGTSKHHGSQPLLTMYERLKPFQKDFVTKDAVYLGARAVELHNYLGYGSGRAIDLQALTALPTGQTVADFLDRERVTLVYLDRDWVERLEAQQPGTIRPFLSSASEGWRVVGAGQSKTDWWLVLARRTPESEARPELPLELR
jgi:hypothetical protein